jgi:hypothetical protein
MESEIVIKKEDTTTMQVKKPTRARLDKIRDIHVESYDDVINKLLDFYESKKK